MIHKTNIKLNYLKTNNTFEIMKNLKNFTPSILLFVAVLLSAITTQAQNVFIPDEQFKTILLANAQINTNGDNEIQNTEATLFSGVLDVSNSSIHDLTGIETFTNLGSLNCSNNKLEALNFTEDNQIGRLNCSKNNLTDLDLFNLKELRSLFCHTNSINNLNLIGNSNLRILIANNNELESLDISTNVFLMEFDCSYNNLVKLDFSSNSILEIINCSENNLSELNLRNHNNVNISSVSLDARHNNLNCVQVDDQDYSNTYWAHKIDASAYYSNNCTALPVKELSQDDFTFFPNPITDVLSVYFGGEFEKVSLEVVNTTGAVVMKKSYENTESVNIDLDVTPGIYMLAVNTGDGNIITKKLIKK